MTYFYLKLERHWLPAAVMPGKARREPWDSQWRFYFKRRGMEKIENIIILGEKFLEALRQLDAKSLGGKDLKELDDLKDRINSHFDFFRESAFHNAGKRKDWFGNNDNK